MIVTSDNLNNSSSEQITRDIDLVYNPFNDFHVETPTPTETVTPSETPTSTETVTPTETPDSFPRIVSRTDNDTREGFLDLDVKTPIQFKGIAIHFNISNISEEKNTLTPVAGTLQDCDLKTRYAIVSTNDTIIPFGNIFEYVEQGDFYRMSFLRIKDESVITNGNVRVIFFNDGKTEYIFDTVYVQGDTIVPPIPTPTPTQTHTNTATYTPTVTTTVTITHPTPTPTMSLTPTITETYTTTVTTTVTITHPTPTPTMSLTPTITETYTPTVTTTVTITHPTPTPTMTTTYTPTASATCTPSYTITFSDVPLSDFFNAGKHPVVFIQEKELLLIDRS